MVCLKSGKFPYCKDCEWRKDIDEQERDFLMPRIVYDSDEEGDLCISFARKLSPDDYEEYVAWLKEQRGTS